MAQPYPVVGIEGTGTHPRLEIRDLQKNPIQFSLFILALNKIHDMRNTVDKNSPDYFNKPDSWWQIGAIHGLPYDPWSGDPNGPQTPASDEWGGYCYHSSALFPTWHRVLVLLVEQAVVNKAIAIASELEAENPVAREEEWLKAAKQLRFPFWDWTRQETATEGIPQILQDPEISIAIPGFRSYSPFKVRNPLNHYRYASNPGRAKDIEYMGDWERTYRWANKNVEPTKELYDRALKAFAEGGTLDLGGHKYQLQPVSWLRAKVAGLFTYDLTVGAGYGPNMWSYFSNTGTGPEGARVYPPMPVMPPSLEESHNKVHLDVGGNGSMAANEYAGFDPIFFLHHCNVDRLYAFWEYLYPKYRIENGWKSKTGEIVPFRTAEGSFYLDKNAEVNHATSLVPFRTKSSNYWTSDNIGDLLKTTLVQKHYTYPAIKDPITGLEVKVDVPYNVNNLVLRGIYQRILHNEWSPDLAEVVQTHQDLSGELSEHVKLLLKEEDELLHLRRFIIIGELPEFAFSGSYHLELYFLEKVGEQTTLHVVNSISVLGRTDPANCPACRDRQAAGNKIRGHMHLDPRLILYLIGRLGADERRGITDLDGLTALILGSLGLRIVRPDGEILAVKDPSAGANNALLEEAKAPQLTLHSHVVSFNPTDNNTPFKFHDTLPHGAFEDGNEWKLF